MSGKQPTNPATAVVDKILSGLIFGLGVQSAVAAAIAAAPWLGFPIIRQLFTAFMQWAAGKIHVGLKDHVNFSIIKFQNEADREAYETAIASLQVAQEKGDTDATDKSIKEAKAALDKLISFNK